MPAKAPQHTQTFWMEALQISNASRVSRQISNACVRVRARRCYCRTRQHHIIINISVLSKHPNVTVGSLSASRFFVRVPLGSAYMADNYPTWIGFSQRYPN